MYDVLRRFVFCHVAKESRATELLHLKITATENELKRLKATLTKKDRFVALFSQDLILL